MIDRESSGWLDIASTTHAQLTRAQTTQAELEAQRRHAICMAVASGCTHREVGERLGVSRARVTVIVNSAAR